ncbi:Protein of unknown function DUF3176 [Penicillium capsulatum]|uniref:Uncharacterized protein n=1 Tax=Penicillium capsulatum TaxID=69766 RepID=A0A9W9IKH7_9EURO|nr:Protein of unknown function DUF3176 [Penicillium capsulatum]KAJ6122729.1 Protein of unknown function DUF3176 [Penicillium capsulatum]
MPTRHAPIERDGLLRTITTSGNPDPPLESVKLDHDRVRKRAYEEGSTELIKDTEKVRSIWLLISDLFIWEVLAILVSTGLMVAIIVILARFDGQPQPTWNHVSFNSVISWLSTISKGCVIYAVKEGLGQLKWAWFSQSTRPMFDLRTFDAASRGVYGSAELIWSLRAKHFAVTGSLAVILALAFDPFTQNLVHYYSALDVNPSETALVSRTPRWLKDEILEILTEVIDAYVDTALKANVYNSLFNSDPSKPWAIPKYTCSTGNCTWDPIATLEIQAGCRNITDRLKISCRPDERKYQLRGMQNCTVALPGKDAISAYFINNTQQEMTMEGMPLSVGVSPDKTFFGLIQMIAIDGLVQAAPHNLSGQWQAMECGINPIVRSIRISVIRGDYHAETLAVWPNEPAISSPIRRLIQPPWGPELGMEPNTNFTLAPESVMGIQQFMEDLFYGQAVVDWFQGPQFHFLSKPESIYASRDLIQALAYSDITGCTARTAEKLKCAMENVAAAMTKTFRDTEPSRLMMPTEAGYDYQLARHGPPRATGKAKSNTVHITVYWQWFAVPALVWLLGIVTLIGTMWKSRKGVVPMWKTDLIPLLFLYKDFHDEGVSTRDIVEDVHNVRLYKVDDRTVLSG